MVDYDVMFYVMGVVALIGVCSKLVSQFALKRMVRAAGNMNKSTHKLMKLMRAKFEHACMVSDRVQNVSAFVDKYVYEYRVLGLRLHTWQQLQRQAMWACVLLGAMGAGMYYNTYGMGEKVYHYGGIGAALMVLLFLLQAITDEKYLLKSAEVYMVDYLENVCVHRYEKMYQRESTVRTAPAGQAVFAGAGGGDVQGSTEASAEKAEAVKKMESTAGVRTPQLSSVHQDKVVPMGHASAHMEEEDLSDRKNRKEMRREAQDGQKKRRFGKKVAATEAAEPEPIRSTMEQPAASQSTGQTARELLHAAADLIQPEERQEAVNGGVDSAPKEAMIREILEEFLAQRT